MLLATREQSFIRLVNFVPGPFAYFSVMKSMWQNDNKKNIQQQVKGKSYWRTQDRCLSPFLCHHKKHPSTFYVEPLFFCTYVAAFCRCAPLSAWAAGTANVCVGESVIAAQRKILRDFTHIILPIWKGGIIYILSLWTVPRLEILRSVTLRSRMTMSN